MQLSLTKLTAILVVLLIAVTLVTTAAGIFVVRADYQTMDTREEAEGRDAVHNASIAIRNQIRFYQGILQLVTANPEVADLVEFADVPEIINWSRTVGRLLPGTLGTALANPDGVVFGDPLALRVGPQCQIDMKNFVEGGNIDYPLMHNNVAGLEHFDLLAKLHSADGSPAGTLFVSFRLSALRELLEAATLDGDRFELLDKKGEVYLTTGSLQPESGENIGVFRADIPDTGWSLVLHRLKPDRSSVLWNLLIADVLILGLISLLILTLMRATMNRFRTDIQRIHNSMVQVLDGSYQPSEEATAIKETQTLLPDIEHVALALQQQRDDLRHQSLSDPLTGVFNRRYFDLMLAHLYEQSQRQNPAILVIIDLNDFKEINDRYGHNIGDIVLQHFAMLLRERVRASDIVARLGGDEFALILNQMEGGRVEEWLRSLIRDHDRRPVCYSDAAPVHVALSIGVAGIDARHYGTTTEVFSAADSAMYSVKKDRDSQTSRYAVARTNNVTPLNSARDKT